MELLNPARVNHVPSSGKSAPCSPRAISRLRFVRGAGRRGGCIISSMSGAPFPRGKQAARPGEEVGMGSAWFRGQMNRPLLWAAAAEFRCTLGPGVGAGVAAARQPQDPGRTALGLWPRPSAGEAGPCDWPLAPFASSADRKALTVVSDLSSHVCCVRALRLSSVLQIYAGTRFRVSLSCRAPLPSACPRCQLGVGAVSFSQATLPW